MTRSLSFRFFAQSALLVAFVASCSDGATDMPTPGGGAAGPAGPNIDVNSVLNQIQFHQYQNNPMFTQVSTIYRSVKDPKNPDGSDPNGNIAEWISAGAADTYLQIDPAKGEGAGPNVVLPVGTVIIRAVYAQTNYTDLTAVTKLTVMVKGPPSYFNTFGDWAFGVASADGKILTDDGGAGGTLEIGYVPGCHGGCHESTRGSTNDWLFGVDQRYRIGAAAPAAAADAGH